MRLLARAGLRGDALSINALDYRNIFASEMQGYGQPMTMGIAGRRKIFVTILPCWGNKCNSSSTFYARKGIPPINKKYLHTIFIS